MDLGDMALQIVILGIIISIGATVLVNVRDTHVTGTAGCGLNSTNGTGGTLLYNACGSAYNLSDAATTGLAEYGNWFSIIIIVSIAAVILALIFSAFGGRGRGQAAAY